MFATATLKLPAFNVGDFRVDLWNMEPCFIPDKVVGDLQRSPFAPQIFFEEVPKIYKKKYFKGCLKNGMKLLVQRYGGIGDIQWVLPSIRELKNRYPNLKIRFVCFEKDREIIKNCPFIDEFGMTSYPTTEDVKWCDYYLDFFDTVEGIGEDESKSRNPIDISAEIVGVKLENPSGWYKVEDFENEWAETILYGNKLTIALPLVASSPHRSWNRQDELIKLLVEWNPEIRIVILSDRTPQAEPIISRIKDLNLKNVIDMSYKTTLRQMMALINRCDLMVSNDTGAVNLAAYLGKKVVAIYTTVLKKTRTNLYPTVLGVQAKTDCTGCLKLSHKCEKNDLCLSSVSANELFLNVVKLIGG